MKKMFFFFGMLVFLVIINPVYAQSPSQTLSQSPFNYFLRLSGPSGEILGESKNPQHLNSIDVISFKEEMARASSGPKIPGTGGGGGHLQFSDLIVVKRFDRASIELNKFLATGATIKLATLYCSLKSGKQPDPIIMQMQNFVVSGIKFTADPAGVLEEVTFSYGSILKTYYFQLPDGKLMQTGTQLISR